MASDAGGVPSIPWHHTPAPWGTVSCSTGCVMTQILTIAWSPGRTCVSGPCLTYPPSTVETTQQSIKHIHHQLWKQTQQSIKISTINCGNNTTVNQTYPPSIVETTQYKGQSGFLFHHALLSFVCQTDTSTKQFQQFLSLKNTKTTTTTKNKQTKKREQKLPWGWGHVKKQSSAK